MSLFTPPIKKKDIADFCQKLSMLLDAGYDTCSAVELLCYKSADKKRLDRSADGIRAVGGLLLQDLQEGYSLHESMGAKPKVFGDYANQIEVGEKSGKTADVLQRISDQIRNASKIMAKLQGAMAYPLITLALTFVAAAYLFTQVVPDMLQKLQEVGSGEVPALTQMVMNFGFFLSENGVSILITLAIIVLTIVLYSKTIGKYTMSHLVTRLPLIGKVIQNNSMVMYFKAWQQMTFAGAEMSIAMRSAAEAVPNLYMRQKLLSAYEEYRDTGVAAYGALRPIFCVRELEIQSIQVGIEGGRLEKILGILADDREIEAERSVSAMTAAINPILLIIVGLVVGVIVLSVYQPIISVSSTIG